MGTLVEGSSVQGKVMQVPAGASFRVSSISEMMIEL